MNILKLSDLYEDAGELNDYLQGLQAKGKEGAVNQLPTWAIDAIYEHFKDNTHHNYLEDTSGFIGRFTVLRSDVAYDPSTHELIKRNSYSADKLIYQI